MRFFFVTVPISSFVAAFFPKLHAAVFPCATAAKSAYKLADSSLFSASVCPRDARVAFSYSGYTWIGRPMPCVAPVSVAVFSFRAEGSIETDLLSPRVAISEIVPDFWSFLRADHFGIFLAAAKPPTAHC